MTATNDELETRLKAVEAALSVMDVRKDGVQLYVKPAKTQPPASMRTGDLSSQEIVDWVNKVGGKFADPNDKPVGKPTPVKDNGWSEEALSKTITKWPEIPTDQPAGADFTNAWARADKKSAPITESHRANAGVKRIAELEGEVVKLREFHMCFYIDPQWAAWLAIVNSPMLISVKNTKDKWLAAKQ